MEVEVKHILTHKAIAHSLVMCVTLSAPGHDDDGRVLLFVFRFERSAFPLVLVAVLQTEKRNTDHVVTAQRKYFTYVLKSDFFHVFSHTSDAALWITMSVDDPSQVKYFWERTGTQDWPSTLGHSFILQCSHTSPFFPVNLNILKEK